MKAKNVSGIAKSSTILKTCLFVIILVVGVSVTILIGFILQRTEQQKANCKIVQSTAVSISTKNYVCSDPILRSYIVNDVCQETIDISREDIVELFNEVIVEDSDTYSDVETVFGRFEISCTSEEGRDNLNGYNCTYDFVDMGPIIRVNYTDENIASTVRTLGCGS